MYHSNSHRNARSEIFTHKAVEGVVIKAKSRTTGALFGIRFRLSRGGWWMDYAFLLPEGRAVRSEGYGEGKDILGRVHTSESYEGCPDNGDKSYFICNVNAGGCGGVTSFAGGSSAYCAWCGETHYELTEALSIRASEDL